MIPTLYRMATKAAYGFSAEGWLVLHQVSDPQELSGSESQSSSWEEKRRSQTFTAMGQLLAKDRKPPKHRWHSGTMKGYSISLWHTAWCFYTLCRKKQMVVTWGTGISLRTMNSLSLTIAFDCYIWYGFLLPRHLQSTITFSVYGLNLWVCVLETYEFLF